MVALDVADLELAVLHTHCFNFCSPQGVEAFSTLCSISAQALAAIFRNGQQEFFYYRQLIAQKALANQGVDLIREDIDSSKQRTMATLLTRIWPIKQVFESLVSNSRDWGEGIDGESDNLLLDQ